MGPRGICGGAAGSRWGSRGYVCAPIVGMASVPPEGWDGDAYTGRGVIWNGSLTEWSTKGILFGFGRKWYERIVESDTSTLMNGGAYSGHNEFVHLLATGGIVFAVLAVGALLVQGGYVITTPRSRYLAIGAMLVSAIAVSGWLEVPLRFVDGSMYWTVTVIPLAVLFLAPPGDGGHEIPGR